MSNDYWNKICQKNKDTERVGDVKKGAEYAGHDVKKGAEFTGDEIKKGAKSVLVS